MDTLLTSTTIWRFLNDLSEGILILDVDGRVLYLNNAAEQLFALHTQPAHLRAIFEHSATADTWQQWEQILHTPSDTHWHTATTTLSVRAKPIQHEEQALVQLIVTAENEADGRTTNQIQQGNRQLSHIKQLELVSEASRRIASSFEIGAVLQNMGEYACEAVGSLAYIVYEWTSDQQAVRIAISGKSYLMAESQFGSDETYNVSDYPVLAELASEEVTRVVSLESNQGRNTLPTTAVWEQSIDSHQVQLIPLLLSGEPFGLLALRFHADRATLDENESQIIGTLTNQAEAALEKVKLFEDIFQRENFLASLGRVSLAINATLDLPTVLSLICQESITIFNADGVYIWQKQGEMLTGIAAEGHGREQFVEAEQSCTAVEPAFASTIVEKGESQFINQFGSHPTPVQLPQPESIAAVLGIPLAREGHIIGVLVLVDRRNPNRFTLRDIDKANAFAVQVAIAMHNAQLVTALRELNEELDQRVMSRTEALGEERDRFQMLLRITTELSTSLDESRVLTRALELVNSAIHAEQGSILLLDEERDEFIVRAAFGTPDKIPPHGRLSGIHRDEGLAGWVVENQRPIILTNTTQDKRWIVTPNTEDFSSALAVPLLFNDEVVGVLMLFDEDENAFSEEQLRLVNAAGTQVSNAIYNAHLFNLISNQAERLGSTLREAQVNSAKTQAMLESIADGVLVADERGEVILVNVACSDILGIAREELIGQNVMEMSGLYGSSGDSWVQTLRDWAANSDKIEGETYLAEELKIADEQKIVSVHVGPIFAGNQFFGTVSIFRDRTKEVEVDRVKSEFVATVSHELRTPLTSIKGYTDLMLMGAAGALPEAQARYLKVIKANADRLQELVNDLLDISSLEGGKTRLNLRPIDLTKLMAEVKAHIQARSRHEEKTIEVVLNLDDELPLAHADYKRITQVVTNLADNAFNYTQEGGQVTLGVKTNGHYLDVSVRDTGIGIAPENIEKIFDRFYRSDDTRVQKVSGTGLGLAIVQSLVEMHQGELTVSSTLGEGSEFMFNLPFVQADGTTSI